MGWPDAYVTYSQLSNENLDKANAHYVEFKLSVGNQAP